MKGTIKQWRTWRGMTQEELAKRLDVSLPTIWGWEKGKVPSGKNLQALASVFEISADDIILP